MSTATTPSALERLRHAIDAFDGSPIAEDICVACGDCLERHGGDDACQIGSPWEPSPLESSFKSLRAFVDRLRSVITAFEAERAEIQSRLADEFCRGETEGIRRERSAQEAQHEAERRELREKVVRMRGYEYQGEEYGGSGLYEECAPGQGRYLDRREVLTVLDGVR